MQHFFLDEYKNTGHYEIMGTETTSGIGAEIKRRRQLLKINQAELARRAGISRANLWRIERRAIQPIARTLYGVSKALGCTMDDLLRVECKEK